MSTKTIIITGANGFIGNRIINCFKNDFKIIALVKDLDKIKSNKYVDVLYLSSYDKSLLNKLKDIEIPIIVNLAWTGTYQFRNDLNKQLDNLKFLDTIKKIAIQCRTKFIYNFSSIMEFEIINELSNAIAFSNKFYGLAKIVEDYSLNAWSKENNVHYVRFVITNTFGPGENSQRLINVIIKNFINSQSIKLSKCNQLYSFIYIDDLIKITSELIKRKCISPSYIIGDMQPRILKSYIDEIYQTLNNIENKNIWPIYSNDEINSLSLEQLNTINTFSDTNINKITPFNEAIKKTYYYLIKNGGDK